jgi:ornithine cyclodeaminase
MKVLSADDVRQHLPIRDAIECMQEAMMRVAHGEANLPLRTVMDIDGTNKLGIMPGAMTDPTLYGIKVLSLFPGNPALGLSSHIGLVILFESQTGEPLVAMNADAITAVRTAAASAAATRALARRDATCLAIVGTGEQAESHLEAISLVRDLTEVRVVGRSMDRAKAFINAARQSVGAADIQAFDDVQSAVRGADIICTVTSSSDVVLRGEWVQPGTHVNAVGASVPVMQEIDTDLVARSELFVDYRPSALAQARDIIDAIGSSQITEGHIRTEIGAVYAGDAQGRSGEQSITLYRSLGVAAQDLTAANLVWERYRAAQS